MNLLNLFNIIDKKISPLHIEPNLCPQTISPKSSCSSCLQVCPTQAIKIANRSIEIDDNCLECGLCSTVCPTNALLFTKPSISQILEETKRKSKNNEYVYIQCTKNPVHAPVNSTIQVPCLGVFPKEAWMTLMTKYDNLLILHEENECNHCELPTGGKIWRKQLTAAEEITGKSMTITSKIYKTSKKQEYNESRRELLSLFGSELKSTNKLALKQLFADQKVASFQEKLKDNSEEKIRKEWENVSAKLVEKITNEAVEPYMEKRKLFLQILLEDKSLQERQDVRLPTITPDCNFCGACTLLCPTEALTKETVDEKTAIALQPSKCVDCKLCEEVCYFDHLALLPAANKQLFQEKFILANEK